MSNDNSFPVERPVEVQIIHETVRNDDGRSLGDEQECVAFEVVQDMSTNALYAQSVNSLAVRLGSR
jgi:hypothetical protein